MLCSILASLLLAAHRDELSPAEISFLSPNVTYFSRSSRLLSSPRVQKILGLSDHQKAEAELLRLKVREELQRGEGRLRGSFLLRDNGVQLRFDENDGGVMDILDENQRRVLGQIQLQGIGPLAFFRIKPLAVHLDVSDEQQQRLEQAFRTASGIGQGPKQGIERPSASNIAELRSRAAVDPMQFLTDKQRDLVSPLLGDKQPIREIAMELRTLWKAERRPPRAAIQSTIGDFTEPFRLLFVNGLLSALEVNSGQRERLVDWVAAERKACEELETVFREKASAEAAKFKLGYQDDHRKRVQLHWEKLKSILDARQLRRFEEIRLQVRGFNELFSSSEISRQLDVTDEQRSAFKTAIKENPLDPRLYEKMGVILTEKQKSGFARLQGEPISRNLLLDLRASQNMAYSDRFGIPNYGIGDGK